MVSIVTPVETIDLIIPTHKVEITHFIVAGHGSHGKDEACKILARKTGLTFAGSSEVMCSRVIYPLLKDRFGYASEEECFADRRNHRDIWFNAICNYNKGDLARLGKLIFSEHNIYCGIRNKEELDAINEAKLSSCLIWVDASRRVPPEDISSMTVTKDDADYVLNNNGTLEYLEHGIDALISMLQMAGIMRRDLSGDT